MNKETFWQVFLRKDNRAPLVFALAFIVIGLLTAILSPGDRGGWILATGLVILAVDAVLVYLGLNKNR